MTISILTHVHHNELARIFSKIMKQFEIFKTFTQNYFGDGDEKI